MAQPLTIRFEGAARTVTGSRHHITFGERQWLFDCGLYQGRRDEADVINRTFAFDPKTLDAVVLSHAHLDHSGNLPTLFARGFRGPIHATPATGDLCRVLLEDSVALMQKDLEHVNRHRARSAPAREALYRPADVEQTLENLTPHAYHTNWSPFPGVSATYHDAGHILGSALTTFEFESDGRRLRLGMSGDVGRPRRKILRDPESPPGPDALVMECTYGDRVHPGDAETEAGLVEVIERTLARGGRVMVPAFAIGRTQELVATLHELIGAGKVRDVPIFVDSPMAYRSTEVFRRHPECFDAETQDAFTNQDGAPFGFDRLRYITDVAHSRALNDRKGPCIVIAASGMCEGGRILHHLQHGLGDARNTVLFVGFQAEGTLGRRLRDGRNPVNVFGEPVAVKAEIAGLDGFSAHADQHELLDWVASLSPAPKTIFLVHGDLAPAETLAGLLRARIGATVHIPKKGEEFALWS